MSQSNFFIKYLKSISISINSLLKNNLNNLNSNNLVNILSSNKIFLIFVALVILFFSYISLPNIYNQTEVSKELKNQLLKKFNLNIKFSENLNYNFFPRPHYNTNESSIFVDKNKISDVKNIKIYISLRNLFSLKSLKINNIIFNNASFNFNKKNYRFFTNLLDNNFENSKLEIINSNIFFRNIEKEVLFINKIIILKYFYDPKEFKNTIYSESEIFNIPYSLKIFDNKDEKKFFSKLNLAFIKLQLKNIHNYNNDIKKGEAILIIDKLKSFFTYKFQQNFFEFNFFERFKFEYNARFNFNPFYSNISGNTDELNLSYLFNPSSFVAQLIKTEILNNKNINFELKIKADKLSNHNSLVDIILNSKISKFGTSLL